MISFFVNYFLLVHLNLNFSGAPEQLITGRNGRTGKAVRRGRFASKNQLDTIINKESFYNKIRSLYLDLGVVYLLHDL